MSEILDFLIRKLDKDFVIPDSIEEKKNLFRALVNIRPPKPIDKQFLKFQDLYLQEELREKIIDIEDLKTVENDIYLWQGDITHLKVDAIVNVANCKLLGCFIPNHKCIDNAIHTYAGVQLRLKCFEIMKNQGHDEETGCAKITEAFNLPSKYIIHTVGPIVEKNLNEEHKVLLKSCYNSCLELSDEYSLSSIAFPCISTGEFRFPQFEAAKIAIDTVREYKKATNSKIKVLFNVFKDEDLKIYKSLFAANINKSID